MMAWPIKTLELHYPMIQYLIIRDTYWSGFLSIIIIPFGYIRALAQVMEVDTPRLEIRPTAYGLD